MKKFSSTLNGKKVKIIICNNILSQLPKPTFHSQKIIVFCDSRIQSFGKKIQSKLITKKWNSHFISLKSGENLKKQDSVNLIYKKLQLLKADRSTVLMAVGGGTVGDVIGFVASTYLRGLKWIGVPTTMLSQIDSSFGGKTGINTEFGKNLIGTFYQPSSIYCDVSILKSLKNEEILSGMGELLKYGLIKNSQLYSWVLINRNKIFNKNNSILEKMIFECLKTKNEFVKNDLEDMLGVREKLNFGHTFAHALEKTSLFKIPHGQAVLMGMEFAILVSMKLKYLYFNLGQKILNDLIKIPILYKVESDFNFYYNYLLKDKKNKNNQIKMVLLKSIGNSVSQISVSKEVLKWAFQNHPRKK